MSATILRSCECQREVNGQRNPRLKQQDKTTPGRASSCTTEVPSPRTRTSPLTLAGIAGEDDGAPNDPQITAPHRSPSDADARDRLSPKPADRARSALLRRGRASRVRKHRDDRAQAYSALGREGLPFGRQALTSTSDVGGTGDAATKGGRTGEGGTEGEKRRS